MTCIAAVADRKTGHMVMGADAGACNSDLIYPVATPKVIRRGPYLMGFTTSWRFGNLLSESFEPPDDLPGDHRLPGFMVRDFARALQACLSAGGWEEKKDGRRAGGQMMAGVHGRLFTVLGDYSVVEHDPGYAALGKAAPFAWGAMYALGADGYLPEVMVARALAAAAQFSPQVCPPFTILSTYADASDSSASPVLLA